jgi:hypothetical protein
MKKILLVVVIITTCVRICTAQITINSVTPITATIVGRYEKFEVGFNTSPQNFSNVFNPEEINIYAIFTHIQSGETYKINAFWYQDFIRNPNSFDPTYDPCKSNPQNISDPNYLTIKSTPLRWRIRFAPNKIGEWSYKIYTKYNGQQSASNTYYCSVRPSDKKGYIGVADNKRNFTYVDNSKKGDIFLALGVNLFSDGSIVFNRASYNYILSKMQKMNEVNGNTIRIFMTPLDYGIEWSEDGLTNFTSRQNRAYNLDDILTYAEQHNIYVQLILLSGHEFINDPQTSGYNFWPNNPYKPLVTSQYNFFDNQECIKIFKKRLRYIIARWGYSTNLLSYELFNEVDRCYGEDIYNQFGFYANYNYIKVINWHEDIIQYGKDLDPNHMFTTSIASVDPAFTPINPNSSNSMRFYESPFLDYINFHYYSNDMNQNYQLNAIVQIFNKVFDKPVITGEFSPNYSIAWTGASNFTESLFGPGDNAHGNIEFHNSIWSSIFSGQAGSAFYWFMEDLSNPCWGGGHKSFKPLYNFIKDDNFFNESLTYLINKPTGNKGIKDEPNHNYNNNSIPVWSFPNFTPQIVELLLDYGVTTSNNALIDVFAAQSNNKIYGWVHHRLNYWYELPHHAGGDFADYYSMNDNQPSTTSNIPILSKHTITFNNIPCDGMYKVDFYSTYPQYDIDGDNILDEGGIITPFSQSWVQAYCGNLTITIPDLAPLSQDGSSIYAPDYAFKISKINDYWSHSLVNIGLSSTSRISVNNSQKIFYSDVNGAMHSIVFDNISNMFEIEQISASLPNMSTRALSTICANENNQVFYKGTDSRLQCYYWEANTWNHTWLTDWNNNSQNVGEFIVMCPNNIYYQGIDNKIHRYNYNYNSNSNSYNWEHSILPTGGDINKNIIGPLSVNAQGTQIYYKGQDGRLQCYYWESNMWNHRWMTNWSNNSQNISGDLISSAEGIFYAGTDGFLHKYFFNINTNDWEHTWVMNSNNQYIYVPANTQISMVGDADQIFFMGLDNHIHHLYEKNGNKYYQDMVICYDDLQNEYKSNGKIASTSEGVVYYIGLDNMIHMYAFDSGCNPRDKRLKQQKKINYKQNTHVIEKDLANSHISKFDLNDFHYPDAEKIKIYPNPFNDRIQISLSHIDNISIKIFDVMGRIVFFDDNHPTDKAINTFNLVEGVYMILIEKNGGCIIKEKIIKINNNK